MQKEGPAPEGKQRPQLLGRRWEEGRADQMSSLLNGLVAVLLLAITAPLMLLAALAIKCESPGPMLEKQPCIGAGGRRFELLNFRTTDYRQPRVGRARNLTQVGQVLRYTRIEALPQLINVLRGEMSILHIDKDPPSFLV
jgi:lipopolysaccharide/colanic/teichoic acid biosynthesis glycosyltransferase